MASRPTFNPLIRLRLRRADGSVPVRMRVTYKRVARELPTNIVATSSELTRSGKLKKGQAFDAFVNLQREFEREVADLSIFKMEQMEVDDIIEYIKARMQARNFSLDLFEYWEQQARRKKPATQLNYMGALNNFRGWVRQEHLDINDVTSKMLARYVKDETDRLGARATAPYGRLNILRAVSAAAKKDFNTEEAGELVVRDPFDFFKYKMPETVVHKDISVESLRTLIKLQRKGDLKPRHKLALEVYLLSFCLIGMNAADLFELAPPKGDVLVYNRHKTRDNRVDRAEMHVRLEPQVMAIWEQYRDKNAAASGKALNLYTLYKDYKQMDRNITVTLQRWAKNIIPEHLTFYTARHSWATIAYKIGIDSGVITDALCHVDRGRKIDAGYIHKDWARVWDANKKVLEFVFNFAENGKSDN